MSMHYAHEAEKIHAGLYGKARIKAKTGKDKEIGDTQKRNH
jgi:hypothetical protein